MPEPFRARFIFCCSGQGVSGPNFFSPTAMPAAQVSTQQLANRRRLYDRAPGLVDTYELTQAEVLELCELAGIQVAGGCFCNLVRDAFFAYYRATLDCIDRRPPFLAPATKQYRAARQAHEAATPWLVTLYRKGNLYAA